MLSTLTLSIGIGLLICLIFVEFIGLMTGGMVVPGYIALAIHNPGTVTLTLIAALLIFYIVRLLSRFLVVYGRRRIALIMLLSFIVGFFLRDLFSSYYLASTLGSLYTVIGYIIPGLIALSFDRQGIIETVTSLLIASVFVRLILILLIGNNVGLL